MLGRLHHDRYQISRKIDILVRDLDQLVHGVYLLGYQH